MSVGFSAALLFQLCCAWLCLAKVTSAEKPLRSHQRCPLGNSSIIHDAAWTREILGQQRRAVILTSCDRKCMDLYFGFYMESVKKARGGDFSLHIIFIASGLAANLKCKDLQKKYRHQCVYLRRESPHEARPFLGDDIARGMEFQGPLYMLAMLQKVECANEILKTYDVSVVWLDMDIVMFANPLQFLFEAAPDADLITQSEDWNKKAYFSGNVCERDPPERQPKGALGRIQSFISPSSNACNSMFANGGFWMFNPTPGGRALLQTWAARMTYEMVVKQELWSRRVLDQDMLNELLHDHQDVPQYSWNATHQEYAFTGLLVHDDSLLINVHHISGQIMQSNCWGLCGKMDLVHPFDHYFEGNGSHLVCVMPSSAAARMMAIHQNCLADPLVKQRHMELLGNFSMDEGKFKRAGKVVYPSSLELPTGS